jgi:uncharacterized coiled-coil protein SlyX
MNKTETRLYDLEKSAAKHDREIQAIRKLLIQGGKYLAKTAELQKENEKVLNRLLRSLEKGGTNGHGEKKL